MLLADRNFTPTIEQDGKLRQGKWMALKDRARLSLFGCCHEMVKHRESRRCETKNGIPWLFGGPDALQQLTSARINRCIANIEADINAEYKAK